MSSNLDVPLGAPPDTAPAPAADDRADLGILLVHGIGQQRQGETLAQFAEPIIEWIRDWLFHESPSGTNVAAIPIRGRLRPPLLATTDPAHAEVLIATARQGTGDAQRWLFAEAWWGPQVLVPSIGGFTAWLLTRASWLLLFHLQSGPAPRSKLRLGLTILRGLLVFVVWSVLSLLINAVLIVGSLAAVIPLGAVRRSVYATLRAVTGIVGDSYVLIRSPTQRVAFQESALHAMTWLRPRCKRLAIVAHSQGAAVAHGALNRDDAPEADLFVTVGAGIAKLEALRYFERLPASERVAASLAAPLLLVALFVWLRVHQLGLEDFSSRVAAPVAVAIFGLAMLIVAWVTVYQALRSLRERSDRLSLADQQPTLDWFDLYAPSDPVPGGALTRYFDLPGVKSEEVHVLGSLLRDHTSYWAARATFLPRLIEQLGRCGKTTLFDLSAADERLRRGDTSHRRSLKLLQLSNWCDALALLVPVIAAHQRLIDNVDALRQLVRRKGSSGDGDAPFAFLDTAVSSVEQALRWTADVVVGSEAPWARGTVNWIVGFALLLLLLLGWKRIAFPMWQTWAGNRYEEALRDERPAADAAPPEAGTESRLTKAVSAVMLNGAFTMILMLPLALSLLWSFKPGWVGEQQIYALLGGGAAMLTLLIWAFALLIGLAPQLAPAMQRLRTLAGGDLRQWPSVDELLKLLSRLPAQFRGFVFVLMLGVFGAQVVGWESTAFVEAMTNMLILAFLVYMLARGFVELRLRLRTLAVPAAKRRLCTAMPLLVLLAVGALMLWHRVALMPSLTSAGLLGWISLLIVNRVHRRGRTGP